MITNVLLISEKYLKSNSLINNNVDTCYIVPAIQTAQELGLQPILGTKLYTKLCEMVQDNTISTNDDYKLLLDDYVLPYLVQKVMAEIQIPLWQKTRNAGIIQSQDNNMYQLSIKDVQFVKANFESTAQFYGNRLTDYIHANKKKYPEYCKCDTCADMPSGDDGKTVSGMFLGKNKIVRKRP